jgi:hypothetical protein
MFESASLRRFRQLHHMNRKKQTGISPHLPALTARLPIALSAEIVRTDRANARATPFAGIGRRVRREAQAPGDQIIDATSSADGTALIRFDPQAAMCIDESRDRTAPRRGHRQGLIDRKKPDMYWSALART